MQTVVSSQWYHRSKITKPFS